MGAVESKTDGFRDLHVAGRPLIMPNPWDAGTARVLAALGFAALATTSSGFAATLGRRDGDIDREQALAHAASIVAAVELPVSADLENGFADHSQGVADTVTAAVDVGLAGCSIEDWREGPEAGLYPREAAVERVAAAAQAAHQGTGLVLTARAENHIRGNPDLTDTIARLQAYEAAGADVLYAPGLVELEDIRRVVESVQRPVNVLLRPGMAPVAELAEVGVARVSVGGAFAQVALAALARAGRELREDGSYGFFTLAGEGAELMRTAFPG